MSIIEEDINTPENLSLLLDSFDELLGMHTIFLEDINSILDEENQNQRSRRNSYRSAWSLKEGIVFTLKFFTLTLVNLGKIPIEEGVREFLEERKKKEDGSYFVYYPSAKYNIKKTFEYAYLYFKSKEPINFSDSNWQALSLSLDKRNELVHPKKIEQLTVLDRDMENLRSGLIWFVKALNTFQEELQRNFDKGSIGS